MKALIALTTYSASIGFVILSANIHPALIVPFGATAVLCGRTLRRFMRNRAAFERLMQAS